ncbi:MAG: ATP-binding protein, partial [Sphingorhabdus sp.]
RSSVDKMNELLARLSQHNKTKHNPPIAIDIGEAVMNAVHSSRLVYPVEAQLAPGLFVFADPSRIETIIGHLVQNAIEATPDGAPVKITCRTQGNQVAVNIVDTGVGMSESFISDQLFKPFESTKPSGFGIGAYEARALALSMGGNLRVDSRPGKGTIFTLLLPSAIERSDSASHQEAA